MNSADPPSPLPSSSSTPTTSAPTTPDFRAPHILLAAIALGMLSSFLFSTANDPASVGLNVSLWVAAVLLTLVLLTRRWRQSLTWESRALLGTGAVFATLLAVRDTPLLTLLNSFGLAAAFGLALPNTRHTALATGGLARHALSLLESGINGLIGSPLLIGLTPWTHLAARSRQRRSAPYVRGVLLALPVVLLFGALLSSADAAFGTLVSRTFSWDMNGIVTHTLRTVFWAWLLAGVLYTALLSSPWHAQTTQGLERTRLGMTEIHIVLGSVALLFAAFIGVQFTYFFGGSAHVAALTGVTYAEYARRGFFELVTVAALVLPLLLGAYHLTPDRSRASYKLLNIVIVALVVMILASAWQRMMLYVSAYGLTEDRVLAVTFMTWVALALAWFALSTTRGQYARFTFVAVMLGFASILILNALNPAALIVRANLQHAARNPDRPLDTHYLTRLGADAVPALTASAGQGSITGPALDVLRARYARPGGWRTWNRSRARAADLLGRSGAPR